MVFPESERRARVSVLDHLVGPGLPAISNPIIISPPL